MNQKDYVDHGRREVKGWLTWIDGEIIRTLMSTFSGNNLTVLEFGVDRGKSLILFSLSENIARIVGIDLFDLQEFNRDSSGFGNYRELQDNLRKFGLLGSERIRLLKQDTMSFTKNEESLRGFEVALAHIDGGHSKEVVLNDLGIVSHYLGNNGIIVLDDFQRPDWPEVSQAIYLWLEENPQFKIFCIGHNKVYLCFDSKHKENISLLESNERLKFFKRKDYVINGLKVPIYFHFVLPEWTMKVRFYEYLRLFHPTLFILLKQTINFLRSKSK